MKITGSYRKQFSAMRQTKKLTNAEQIALIEAYQSGDNSAPEKLIRGMSGLILKVCGKHHNCYKNRYDPDDVIQIAMMAFYDSIRNFDTSKKKSKFSTYVCRAMQLRIVSQTFIISNIIRIPSNLSYKPSEVIAKVENKSKIDSHEFDILNATTVQCSEFHPKGFVFKSLKTKSFADNIELKDALKFELKKVLTPQEFTVIESLHGLFGNDSLMQREVCKLIKPTFNCHDGHVSHQRVSQLYSSGLRKIKKSEAVREIWEALR